MCGIFGEINWDNRLSESYSIISILEKLKHRGPDNQSCVKGQDNNFLFGHVRLSIIDLSVSANQPMTDCYNGNVIVFNGEIYNFRELREQLEAQGSSFQTNSDTEVILSLYRKYGCHCVKYLDGMFSFAIWDNKNNTVFLARDPCGKKPLYYSQNKSSLFFCSEINPLIEIPEINKQIDHESLQLYLYLQYIPSPWTIYQGIRKIPPGHYAIVKPGVIAIEKYWGVNYSNKEDHKNTEEIFGIKLKKAIEKRMIADVEVGALLSGGVDSSLIVAIMSELNVNPVNTFTIGFRDKNYDESDYARNISNKFGTIFNHKYIDLKPGDLNKATFYSFGEPFGDSSFIPSLMVYHEASKKLKVVLTGDGGDELFGGYQRYQLQFYQILLGKFLGSLVSPVYLSELVESGSAYLLNRSLKGLIVRYVNPELRSFLNYDANWNHLFQKKLIRKEYFVNQIIKSWTLGFLREARSSANNPFERMLWIDNHTWLPGDFLVKVDISSMQHGLETRSPFLDRDLIEFCSTIRIKDKFNINGMGTKSFLKKYALNYFDKDFILRSKKGFSVPLKEWMHGPLKNNVIEVLSNSELMSYFNQTYIKSTLQDFYSGNNNLTNRIWALFAFGKWMANK